MSELSEKYENLKVSTRNDEEEASRRLDAVEKKSETRLQEFRAFKCRVGTILESERFADLTIEVEGRTIKAHRCILASRLCGKLVCSSSVFAAMFKSPMQESTTGILKLSDINFDTASVAKHYTYTSEILADFALEECESLLNFAEMYDVYMMKDDIESAMKRLLNAQNAFQFLDFAYEFKLRELQAMAEVVFQENFTTKEMKANMRSSFEKGLQSLLEKGRKIHL